MITPSNPAPGRRHFHPHDRIGFHAGTPRAVYYRCIAANEEGYTLERVDQANFFETFTLAEFARLEKSPGYRYDPKWFDIANADARRVSGLDKFACIPDRELPIVNWRYGWCLAFLAKEVAGETTRTEESMTAIIPIIAANLAANAIRKPNSKRKPRVGTKTEVTESPSPKTLLRWLNKLEEGGNQASALRKKYRNCGKHPPMRDPEIEEILARNAALYASDKNSTKSGLHLKVLEEVQTLNKARVAAGREPFPEPCDKTFFKRIAPTTSYAVIAGRKSFEDAQKQFWMVGGGLDVNRPGERIEIDEWEVSLQTILSFKAIWNKLTPEERELVPRVRVWLSVAIDVATQCILGARIAPSANSVSAIATLAMVTADKGVYADSAGALTPWDMHCGIETVATDQGSAYIADDFRAAVCRLGGSIFNPPAGLPQMRAHVERVLGTFHTQFVTNFTGGTRCNPVVLGSYPAESRASLLVESISQPFIRYVVDAYHNSKHDGLGGETPRNCWIRKTKLYGTVGIPDPDTRRKVFGIRVERALTNKGVRFLNLYYQSLELHAYRRKMGDCRVQIIVDPACMGWISVDVGAGCLTVPCIQAGFEDVDAENWIATLADLRRRYAAEAKLTEDIVLKAYAFIRAQSDLAVKMADLGSTMLSAEELNNAERKLLISWAPPADPEALPGEGDEADVMTGLLNNDAAETPSAAKPEATPPTESNWDIE